MDDGTKKIIKELIAKNKSLEDALKDCSSALEYIRMQHGDLYGVAYDRALNKAMNALEI